MKTGMILMTAAVGMLALSTAPAKAHDPMVDVTFHLGPAYVMYRDGFHRVDRPMRRWHTLRRDHRWGHRHRFAANDLWHRCYDGRWYRYYDRKHLRFHEKRDRRHKHRHGRRGYRH